MTLARHSAHAREGGGCGLLQALTGRGGGGTTGGVTRIVDSDQHLYESRSLWADHIDPAARDDALSLVDDELGYTWLSWHGAHLGLADVHLPGNTASCGEHRNRQRAGEPASYRYDEALPAAYWQPASRLRWLDEAGLDEAVLFPNFGLLWERRLSPSLPAMTANMTAWNRWCAVVRAEGGGRLHPVAHLTLRDPKWLEAELDTLAGAGITLAMIGAGPVDGRELSVTCSIGVSVFPRDGMDVQTLLRNADTCGISLTFPGGLFTLSITVSVGLRLRQFWLRDSVFLFCVKVR